jgi:Vanillate O-demethylase oxygenase C-terminal domain
LDEEPAPFLQKLKTWKGNVDRWNIYEFFLPGVLLMDSGSALAGTGAASGTRLDAACFFGCQAITPESERTTHYFFQQSHGFALDDPEVTEKLTASILDGFDEDKRMITCQQRILELDAEVPLVALRMDVALAGFRTLLQRTIDAESAVQDSTSNRSQAVS